MREDFEVSVGGVGAICVYVSVTNRDNDEMRAQLVVIRDDSKDSELWLDPEAAIELGSWLRSHAYKAVGQHESRSFTFELEGELDDLRIHVAATDPRLGAVTVGGKVATPLSAFVTRAAEAVTMIERLDGMDEAPEPDVPLWWA